MHRRLSIGFFILSLVFLLPGLTLPMMTLSASASKSEMLDLAVNTLFGADGGGTMISRLADTIISQMNVTGSVEMFEKTRSIIGTMEALISSGNYLVGLLIGLFAVVIPTTKLLLIMGAALMGTVAKRNRLQKASSLISKWSMTDVFVMAILVGYLAANATEDSNDPIQMNAELGIGFYFFTAYCLTSIISAQLMDTHDQNRY